MDVESTGISVWRRVIVGGLAVLFLWAAYLQVNDANAVVWIALYALGALVAGAAAAGWPLSTRLAGGLTAAYLAGAGFLAIEIFWFGTATAMYPDATGGDTGIFALKEGREMFGLTFLAAAIALSSRRG